MTVRARGQNAKAKQKASRVRKDITARLTSEPEGTTLHRFYLEPWVLH